MRTFAVMGLFLLCIQLSVLPQAKRAAGEGAKYVGYRYEGVVPSKVLPNGVKHLGGGLIGNINADPVYGISQTVKGNLAMLWLEVSTGQDASGVTGWRVLDVLAFRNLPKSESLLIAGDPSISCTRAGRELPHLVGRGRIVRSRGAFVPVQLWVANIATKKFDSIAVGGVTCEYLEP